MPSTIDIADLTGPNAADLIEAERAKKIEHLFKKKFNHAYAEISIRNTNKLATQNNAPLILSIYRDTQKLGFIDIKRLEVSKPFIMNSYISIDRLEHYLIELRLTNANTKQVCAKKTIHENVPATLIKKRV